MAPFGLILSFLLNAFVSVPQGPAVAGDWGQLAQGSKIVVVGVVEEVSPVIDGDKQISKTSAAAGGGVTVELQNPADYILGRVVRLRVKEVVKPDGSIKAGGTVDVFLPGSFAAEGQPAPMKKATYLLFLSPLKLSKEFNRAYVQPEGQPSKRVPFTPRLNYRVVDNSNGALEVNAGTQGAIEQVKSAIRTSIGH
jgi:hypothetical protein